MRRTILFLFLAAIPLFASAQSTELSSQPVSSPTMAELFRQMPNSLTPYLSTNSRLDLVDFMEAGMKSEVANLLDGKTQMTALTPDSLSISMSGVMRLDMKCYTDPQAADGSNVRIRVTHTYLLDDHLSDVITEVYSADWQKLWK